MDYQYPGLFMEKYTPLKFCLKPREGGKGAERAAFPSRDDRTSKLYLPLEIKLLAAG